MARIPARTQAREGDGAAIEGSTFGVVRRGWDRAEVSRYIEGLRVERQSLARDRDAHVEQTRQLAGQLAAAQRQQAAMHAETTRLNDQLRRLSAAPENVEGMSERMRWMIQLARDEAEEIRRKAAIEGSEVVARAEEVRVRNEAVRGEIDAERAAMETTREQLLAAAHEEANRVRREAVEEQTRLDAESVARRATIEEEFSNAIATRRNQLLATLAQTDASSREEAERRRADATEQSRRLLTTASEEAQRKTASVELQLTQLHGARRQIAEQLAAAHAALGQVLGRIKPPDDDPPTRRAPNGSLAGSDPAAQVGPTPAGPTSARPHPKPRSTTP